MVSGFSLFFSLFNNVTILIALISLYILLYSLTEKYNFFLRQLITGTCFGLFAIGCMYARIPVFEGVIVDQRNAIIALGAAFGGPLAGFISAAFAGLFRVYLGGSGVLAGVIGVSLASTAGTLLYFWKNSFSVIQNAVIRSLIAVIIILPGFLFVDDLATGWQLMLDMAVPYGTAIFLGILFGGVLINNQKKRVDIKKALKISEEKYRVLFESFPLGISILDKDGNIIETNTISENLVGINSEEHNKLSIDSPVWNVVSENGQQLEANAYPGFIALKENRKIENSVIGIIHPDEKLVWLNVTATPIPLPGYGVAIVYHDISERKIFESSLKKALEEKNVLIQELYHRTRNNMQMIIALLGIQGNNLEDTKCNIILTETQNKIYSMALVHEKLYQSQDLLNISLSDYIRDLTSLLIYNLEINESKIRVDYHLTEEDIEIDIDTAIPLGLVLQELISNTLKHAFPGSHRGSLMIQLEQEADETLRLTIADDGIGIPETEKLEKTGKIGISTIINLVEQQLGGAVSFDTSAGVKCLVRFANTERLNRLNVG